MEEKITYRAPLQWGVLDPYRCGRTHVGMWAWLLQRVSACFIVLFLVLHLCFTYIPFLQFMLLMSVAFHAALGLRVIILDCNLTDITNHKKLIYVLLGITVVLALAVFASIY